MEIVNVILSLIVLPLGLGFLWLIGFFFRDNVLKLNLDKFNWIIQSIITIAIGFFVLLIYMTIMQELGLIQNDF